MPKAKYLDIYAHLQEKIETEELRYGQFLPSETHLVAVYQCSRNTVRRAIALLVTEGKLQVMHGRGVQVIHHKKEPVLFPVNKLEGFIESMTGYQWQNQLLHFEEIKTDNSLAKQSLFPLDSRLFYVCRLRKIEGKPVVIDYSYFLKSAMPNLTPAIAQNSIFKYLEEELKMKITNSNRFITIEEATPIDTQYLELEKSPYNCVVVVNSQTYNSQGLMFEYTKSLRHPACFSFSSHAIR